MAIMQKKQQTTNIITDLEGERAALQSKIEEHTTRLAAMQEELITLLSKQRAAQAQRVPLQRAHDAAQAVLQEARAALQRNLGKAQEIIYSDKFAEAEATADAAQVALASAPDMQKMGVRIAELREGMAACEAAIPALKREVEKVGAAANNAALLQIFTAMSDLFAALEVGGLTVARLRNDDPEFWEQFFRIVSLDRDLLAQCVTPTFNSSDFSGCWRPELEERQAAVKAHLASLNKKK